MIARINSGALKSVDNDGSWSTFINKLLKIAVNAPSGDNTQPWRFKVKEGELDVYLIREGDSSPFNFMERGSYIANGAVIENIVIEASGRGYLAEVILFPEEENKELIARIRFEKTNVAADPLREAIQKRVTNRKPYRKEELSDHVLKDLINLTQNEGGCTVRFVTDEKSKQTIASALSTTDKFLFEVRDIHDAIFDKIRWSTSHELKMKNGLFIKTLELSPPVQLAFRIFRYWPFAFLLGKLNIGGIVAQQTASLYAQSGAIGLITITGKTPRDFVTLGRFMQRLWLAATNAKLAFQPVTALPYLAQRIHEGDSNLFTHEQRKAVLAAESTVKKVFSALVSEVPAFIFRLGVAAPPSAQSAKMAPTF